ncbi:hypothetical protein ACFX11_028481 [Malus domestica]
MLNLAFPGWWLMWKRGRILRSQAMWKRCSDDVWKFWKSIDDVWKFWKCDSSDDVWKFSKRKFWKSIDDFWKFWKSDGNWMVADVEERQDIAKSSYVEEMQRRRCSDITLP